MGTLHTILIHTPCYELQDDRLEPPLGLLYVATWLNQNGYGTEILDLSSEPLSDDLSGIPRADVYGFSTYTPTYHRTIEITQGLQQAYPEAWMVAGGPHASAMPNAVSKDFDFVVRSEGEMALLRILRGLERGIEIPPILCEPVIENLDNLPFPDYTLVDINSYSRVVNGKRSLSILTSRGCPYDCVFCNSIVMGRSQSVRFRSAQNVAEEVMSLKETWEVDAFRFEDDTFTLNTVRLREISKLLRNEKITYRCFGRVNHCTREVTDLLYESGCKHIAFGVESGSPEILRRMMKGQTVDDIRRGIQNAKASGLLVRVFLLVGFPGETWETVQATIDLMLECMPHEFCVYPVIPYPGTPLYERPGDFGITYIDDDFSQYFQVAKGRRSGYILRTKDLNGTKIADMRDYVIRHLEPAIQWAGDSAKYK